MEEMEDRQQICIKTASNAYSTSHSDSRQYIKADISNLSDSTEVPIVALYAFTGDEEVIN